MHELDAKRLARCRTPIEYLAAREPVPREPLGDVGAPAEQRRSSGRERLRSTLEASVRIQQQAPRRGRFGVVVEEGGEGVDGLRKQLDVVVCKVQVRSARFARGPVARVELSKVL